MCMKIYYINEPSTSFLYFCFKTKENCSKFPQRTCNEFSVYVWSDEMYTNYFLLMGILTVPFKTECKRKYFKTLNLTFLNKFSCLNCTELIHSCGLRNGVSWIVLELFQKLQNTTFEQNIDMYVTLISSQIKGNFYVDDNFFKSCKRCQIK